MSKAASRCDQILSLIDRCLAECAPSSIERSVSSDQPVRPAAQAA
jgi:hypothetical protein